MVNLEICELVMRLGDWRRIFVAHAEIQHQLWRDPPVILQERRHCPSTHMTTWITNEDLSVTRSVTGHKILQRTECHLPAPAVERATAANGRGAELASHLQSV